AGHLAESEPRSLVLQHLRRAGDREGYDNLASWHGIDPVAAELGAVLNRDLSDGSPRRTIPSDLDLGRHVLPKQCRDHHVDILAEDHVGIDFSQLVQRMPQATTQIVVQTMPRTPHANSQIRSNLCSP